MWWKYIYLLGFIFIVLPILAFYTYKSINKKIAPPAPIIEPKSNTVKTVNIVNPTTAVAVAAPVHVAPQLGYHASNLVDWSNVGGCISSKKEAACYDHNGVRVILPSDTVRAALVHAGPCVKWQSRPKEERRRETLPFYRLLSPLLPLLQSRLSRALMTLLYPLIVPQVHSSII